MPGDPYNATDKKNATLGTDGVTRCPCGSEQFKYEESHPSERTQARNEDGLLSFNDEFRWFDGDDDPGVVCEGCGATIVLPEGVTADFI